MSWVETMTACIRKCCGRSNKECDSFATEMPSFQSTYTVRRISSFGQTIIDEKGEELEIERHASIIRYDGNTVPWISKPSPIQPEIEHHGSILKYEGNSLPWTSKPAPIQPGVTHLDVKNQIEKLPTITEVPTKLKSKHRWKKTGAIHKDIALNEAKKKNRETPQSVQLKSIKYLEEPSLDLGKNSRPDVISSSHENLFSKCKKKSIDECSSKSFLGLPSLNVKSLSTPDLVDCEKKEKSKVKAAYSPFFNRKLLKSASAQGAAQQVDMQEVKESEEQAKNRKDAEKVAREYGLDLTLYTEEALNESIKSVVPCPNIQTWVEDPVGTIVLTVNLNTLQKMLNVTVLSIESLCGEGLEKEAFATIIKLILIGSKKFVKTSKRIEQQWRSSVNQNFTFLIKDMDFRSMRVLVYNADWLGKHDAMAYGLLSLQHLLDKSANLQIKLYSQPNFGSDVGMMQMAFSFDGEIFTVKVEKIFNYDFKIRNWKVYTKIAYYSLSKKVKERLSDLMWSEKGENELVVNHSASFRVDASGRKHSYILITLKRGDGHGMFKADRTLGRVMLGPSFFYEGGRRLTPWGLAITTKQEYCYSFKIYS